MSSATSGSEFPAPNLPPRTKKPGPRSKPAGEAAGDQGDDPALSNDRDAARGPVLPALPTRRHREKQRSIRRPKFGTWTVATSLLLFATVALYGYGTATLVEGNESPLGGIVLLPMLIGLAVLITWKASAAETRFDLRGIMIFGLALRLMSAYFRFLASVDATVYHQEGSRIVPELRNFNFWVDTGRPVPGTGWIRLISGISHVFVDDMFTTFLVFTFLAFVGTYLCYQAFQFAVPDGDHRRYALLIFLWPSLAFWPSSIGKEGWMILGIGIAAWGVSRVVTGHASIGLPVLVLGLLTISVVRPHIALMILVGFAVSMLARPSRQTSVRLFGRIFSIALLLIGGALIAGKTAELLKVNDSEGTEAIAAGLDVAQAKTEQGGASFTPAVVRNPADYPAAFVTVWFRPFPWEARGAGGDSAATQLLSSAENVFLLLFLLYSWRRILALPRALLRVPYAAFSITYSFVFVYAFAVIGNFGILARQRTQGLILFFVILCIPVLDRAAPASARGRKRVGSLSRRRDPAPDAAPTSAAP